MQATARLENATKPAHVKFKMGKPKPKGKWKMGSKKKAC